MTAVVRMAYRVCVSFISQYYSLYDPEKAGKGHAEYSKASGCLSELFQLILITTLEHSAPNITVVGLLRLRKCLNSLREDKKQGNDLDDSPIFETFSHLIGQNSSNFLDRPGRLFSFIMTLTFFLVTILLETSKNVTTLRWRHSS